MSRTVWKWMFGISLAILILLIIFTFAVWALINATGAFTAGVMGNSDLPYLTFHQFLMDAIGSPIFYAYIIDLVFLIPSLIMLIVSTKQ